MKNSPKPNYRDYSLEELYKAKASLDIKKYPERYKEIRARIKLRESTEPNYDEYTLAELYQAEGSVNREKYPELYMRPGISIWLKPRATIQQITSSGNFGFRVLIIAYVISHGLSSVLDTADNENILELFVESLSVLILGPIIAIIVLFIFGTMVYWIGKQMGGDASRADIYTALVWSSLPLTCATVLELVVKIIRFIPATNFNGVITAYIFIGLIITLIKFITTIWAFIILVNCLKQVQKFSMGKAIISALSIPILNVVIGLILISSVA